VEFCRISASAEAPEKCGDISGSLYQVLDLSGQSLAPEGSAFTRGLGGRRPA
jgi:hypothetical protein